MVLKLLFAAPVLFLAVSTVGAQSIEAPPIKMGLWEATVGSLKVRSCVTPQTYQQTLAKMPAGCTISNQVETSSSFSGDVSCTLPNNVSSSGHFQTSFPNSETIHTTVTMTMTVQGRTMPMNSTTDSHFISSDCGAVLPGKAQVVH